ncbi:MAG: Gfo/Idh/MocA family oxidoreductase [Planctomycetes bacterium]|nr:Gfo/Idh/MocA family oxidoreductase [Planctomycetota bacterium]
MFSAGIIGCGYVACEAPDSHAQAYMDCPSTELICFIDTDKDKALAAYRKYRITHFTFDEGTGFDSVGKFATKFDIASICTPTGDGRFMTRLHRVWDAIKTHGVKAIYLEKPIAASLGEAEAIISCCRENNVLLVVNHQRQFINPKFTFSRGILHTGTHAFDLIRQLFGEVMLLAKNYCITENGLTIELEYKDTDERCFELDCTRSKERMILKGVEHIVECLNSHDINQDSGISAKRDLQLCLEYERILNNAK